MPNGWEKVATGLAIVLFGCIAVSFLMPSVTPHGTQNSDARPPRIISISPSATEIIYAIGAGDMLVGVDQFSNFPEEARTLPRVGGVTDPELEKIASLAPTLIILRGRQEQIESLARDQKIEVYLDPSRTLEDIFQNILEIGRLAGLKQEGAQLRDAMRMQLQEIGNQVAQRPRVRVLLVVSRDKDQLANIMTVGRTSYLTSLIECAGGVSIFADQELDYPMVRVESILDRKPDVIIDSMPDEPDDPDRKKFLVEQWNSLAPVPAVQNHRIFVVTDPYVTIPSNRIVQLTRDMAQWFHPEPTP